MKYIKLIFLNFLLLIGCSETEKISEPPPPIVNPTPPPADKIDFSKAMEGRLVWDSTGEELTGKDGDLLYQETVRYTLIKKINETQAVYGTPNKYIGIELYDNNKQAVMYKKGTVETWDTWEEVSFDSINRLVSSAKGEWIASIQDKVVSLGGITYTVKNDGNLYHNNETAFIFMNIPDKQPSLRTPQDNKERDRAVYKTYATETYLGIRIKNNERSAVFFKKNPEDPNDMWISSDSVSFDPEYEIDPTTEFINNAHGNHLAQDFHNGKFEQENITINSPIGDIGIGGNIRYALEYVLNANQAVYKAKNDNKFLGVEYSGTPKTLKLYKKNSTEHWASDSDVSFIPQHYVDILSAYVNNLKAHSAYQLGDNMFTIKDNGDLHSVNNDTKTYTYVKHLREGRTYNQTRLVYKTADNKYVGIYHDPVKKTIDLYMQNGAYHERAAAWDNASDITIYIFEAENKVSPQGEWTSIRTGISELNDVLIGNLASTIDEDDNFYVFYRNMSVVNTGKGIVQQYNPKTSIWTTLGQTYFTKQQVNYPSIAADNRKNLYTVYSDTHIYVHKYDFTASTWIDFGNNRDLMTNSRSSIPALTINSYNTLFLAYRNGEGKTVVEKRCAGSEWTRLGNNSIFSEEDSFITDTAIAEYDGKVYVVTAGRQDGDMYVPQKVRIAEWNGRTWRELDSFGAGTGSSPDIKVNKAGDIYIAYRDEDQRNRITSGHPTVKKWNGSSWDTVGGIRWGDSVVGDISLDFYNDDTPIVLYGGSSGVDTPTRAFIYNKDLDKWIKIGLNAQVSDNSAKSYYTVGNMASDNTIFTAYGDPDRYSGRTTALKAKKHSRIAVD